MVMNYITFDKDNYYKIMDMENWCTTHFGPGNWISERTPQTWDGMQVTWTIHGAFGRTTFSFRETQDLAWFVLRWGSSNQLTQTCDCVTI
jgi:hypothetical protein